MVEYKNIRDLVECEINKIGKLDQLTEASLHNLDKLVDIRKDIDEMEMNDGIADYYEDWTSGNSYARGRGGYRGGSSYARGGYRGNARYGYGNSYDSGNGMAMEHLHQALNSASTESEREAIRGLINKMQTM